MNIYNDNITVKYYILMTRGMPEKYIRVIDRLVTVQTRG